jgi:predicted RNA binding protein YcfA (HicA-like mRNA interferase family)
MPAFEKDVRDTLLAAGCLLLRQGKGDHEIWKSPVNGRHFVVDGRIKSRHTANEVLKQAGLAKKY